MLWPLTTHAVALCVALTAAGCGPSSNDSSDARTGRSYDERFYATMAMEYLKTAIDAGARTGEAMLEVSQGTTPRASLRTALIDGEAAQAKAWSSIPGQVPSMYASAHAILKEGRDTHQSATTEFLLWFSDNEPSHIAVGQAGIKRAMALNSAALSAISRAAGVDGK